MIQFIPREQKDHEKGTKKQQLSIMTGWLRGCLFTGPSLIFLLFGLIKPLVEVSWEEDENEHQAK